LDYRREEVIAKTQKGMEDSLLALNRIGSQGAQVLEQGRADSRSLKALAIIATMFLPAALLAVRNPLLIPDPVCWGADVFCGFRVSSTPTYSNYNQMVTVKAVHILRW
jgi:hypothetical protein